MNRSLSKPALSVLVYGLYIILFLGLPFLLVPSLILPLVGFPAPSDVWVRVLGMSLLFFGFYYVQMGRNELTNFFRWTVYTRLAVPVFFVVFVAAGLAPPILITFAIPDILFSAWTALALRGQQTASKPATA